MLRYYLLFIACSIKITTNLSTLSSLIEILFSHFLPFFFLEIERFLHLFLLFPVTWFIFRCRIFSLYNSDLKHILFPIFQFKISSTFLLFLLNNNASYTLFFTTVILRIFTSSLLFISICEEITIKYPHHVSSNFLTFKNLTRICQGKITVTIHLESFSFSKK